MPLLAPICDNALLRLLPWGVSAGAVWKMGSAPRVLVLQALLAVVGGRGAGLVGSAMDSLVHSHRRGLEGTCDDDNNGDDDDNNTPIQTQT